MNKKPKLNIFLVLLGSLILFVSSYVPYVRVLHQNNRTFTSHEGFAFIGTLLSNQLVNIPFLMVEFGIILLIFGSYYLFFFRDDD